MKQKLVIALILGAFGASAQATCWLTPQGCGSTSTSSATGGSSTSISTGGASKSYVKNSGNSSIKNSGNSSIKNSGNSSNRNKQKQKQSQGQVQTQSATGGTGGNSSAIGGAGGAGGSGGTGLGGNGVVSIDNHSTTERAAAQAYAPPLTSSNDTCMGSTSAGVQAPGFGISGGTTWTDKNCVMLKNARELWNMGMKAAALARLCMDADNREALEESGVSCPDRDRYFETNDKKDVAVSKHHADGDWDHNDPLIRRRMGYSN